MAEQTSTPAGPDFSQGVEVASIPEGGMLAGRVGADAAILARRNGELFAVGATCTHYGGPLAEGLMVGDTVRCPWHHACFSLRTGQALRAPALTDLKCWHVEQRGGRAFVTHESPPARPAKLTGSKLPESVVIIGGGAAANSAAETLRREGYEGAVTLLSADAAPPCDRPNLSKDYLAGTAQPEWIPLRPPEFYEAQKIDIRCNARVVKIDPARKTVTLADGGHMSYGALLLATGAEPNRLDVPGADLPHVRTLRTLADCNELINRCGSARQCVVMGAGFIGLEAAAALRARGLEVHVVAPGAHPMHRVLGDALGGMLQSLHESHGVKFHPGTTATKIDAKHVTLSNGQVLTADLVLVGIGVHPETELAREAGLQIDRGVTVDEFLQASAPGVWAAGDIARWPDARTGDKIRVEHWIVAERQGATAARNILGRRERFAAVPFFWSQQYDVSVCYVGHAEKWDRVEISGDPGAHDCKATYWNGNRRLAVATVGRDLDSLRSEVEFEGETRA